MAEQDVDMGNVFKILDGLDFDSREQKNIIRRVTRKGGNILKSAVKNLINDNGKFEHIDKIKKGVKVTTSKSRTRPGVNIIIKGSDVLVGQGATRRSWKLTSYSNLVFFGNYKTPNRPTSSGQGRGDVEGTNDKNVFRLAQNRDGQKSMDEVIKNLIPEINKEIAKRNK